MKIIQENSSYLFNNQSLKLISLSEIHIIIQEEEEIFKKSPTVGLPEVSKLTNSAIIRKRQGDRRKNSFLERKKILHKKENGFTMSTSLDGGAMKQPLNNFTKYFSISQNV